MVLRFHFRHAIHGGFTRFHILLESGMAMHFASLENARLAVVDR